MYLSYTTGTNGPGIGLQIGTTSLYGPVPWYDGGSTVEFWVVSDASELFGVFTAVFFSSL